MVTLVAEHSTVTYTLPFEQSEFLECSSPLSVAVWKHPGQRNLETEELFWASGFTGLRVHHHHGLERVGGQEYQQEQRRAHIISPKLEQRECTGNGK